MHCQASQKSLVVLVLLLLLEWTRLILCAAVAGTAESVPSYQAGWQHCLVVFSTSAAM